METCWVQTGNPHRNVIFDPALSSRRTIGITLRAILFIHGRVVISPGRPSSRATLLGEFSDARQAPNIQFDHTPSIEKIDDNLSPNGAMSRVPAQLHEHASNRPQLSIEIHHANIRSAITLWSFLWSHRRSQQKPATEPGADRGKCTSNSKARRWDKMRVRTSISTAPTVRRPAATPVAPRSPKNFFQIFCRRVRPVAPSTSRIRSRHRGVRL